MRPAATAPYSQRGAGAQPLECCGCSNVANADDERQHLAALLQGNRCRVSVNGTQLPPPPGGQACGSGLPFQHPTMPHMVRQLVGAGIGKSNRMC